MNTITKRVPLRADQKQLDVMRDLAEAFDLDVTDQFLSSLYTSAVSAAPVDPLEDAMERKYQRDMGRAA